jgi:hypothetical protein
MDQEATSRAPSRTQVYASRLDGLNSDPSTQRRHGLHVGALCLRRQADFAKLQRSCRGPSIPGLCNRLGPAEARKIWRAAIRRQGPTVTSYIGEHLDALAGVEKKTVAEYRRYLTRDIEPVRGHIPLSTPSRTDVSKWVNKLQADGASGKTISNKLGFLSGVLNLAVKAGEIPGNLGLRYSGAPHRSARNDPPDKRRVPAAAGSVRPQVAPVSRLPSSDRVPVLRSHSIDPSRR